MKLDELYWDLRARTEHLKGDFQAAQREARGFTRSIEGPGGPVEAVGKIGGAGKDLAKELRDSGPAVASSARSLADQIIRTLNQEFRARKSVLRNQLLDGTIDVKEFDKLAAEAGRTFNKGLEAALANLDAKLPPGERQKLIDAFKDVGEDAGVGMGSGATEGIADGALKAGGLLKASLIGAIVLIGIEMVRRAVNIGRKVAAAIREGIEEGSRVIDLRGSFQSLASARDVDAVRFFRELRSEYRLLLTESELLDEATNALRADIPATAGEFEELARAARRSAGAVGEDQAKAFSTLTKSIAAGNEEAIRAIGLNVDFEQAYDDLALSQGTIVKNLSEEDKLRARLNETLAVAKRRLAELGEEQLTAGERLDQLGNFLRSVKERTLELVASSDDVTTFFDALGGGAESAADKVDDLAIKLGSAALGLKSIFLPLLKSIASGSPAFIGAALQELPEKVREAREELERIAETDRRIAQIRAETDPDVLLGRDRDLLRLRQFLDDEKAIAEVDRQRTAIKQRLVALANEEADAARRLRAEAALDASIDASLVKFKELDKAVRQNVQTPNFVSSLDDELRKVAESTRRLIDDAFPEVRRSIEEQIRIGGTEGPERQALAGATRALEDLETQGKSALRIAAEVNTVLIAFGLTFDDLLAKRPEIAKFFDAMSGGLLSGRKPAKDLKDGVSDVVQQFGRGIRGALDFAQALGVMGRDAASSIGSLVNVAEAVGDIVDLADKPGAKFKDFLPAVGAGLAGIGNIVSLIAGSFGETRVGRESRELRQALDRLRERIDKLGDIFASRTGRETTSLLALAGSDVVRGLPTGSRFGGVTREFIDTLSAELDRLGISFFDLEQIAADAGIPIDELLEILRTGKGDVHLAAIEFEGLQEAIDAAREAAKRAAESFTAEWDRVQATFELRDIEDPVEKAGILIDDFTGRLGKLGQVFAGPLGDFDLSTPEGAAAADKFIEKMWKQYQALSFEDKQAFLGNLTEAQFISWISAIEGFVDEAKQGFSGAAGGSTTPVEVRKAITELSANRLIATQDTAIIQRDKIIQILEAGLLGGPVPSFLIAPPVAPPAASAAPSVTLSIAAGAFASGAVQVTVGGVGGGPNGTPDAAALADAIGAAIRQGTAEGLIELVDARLDRIHRVALDAGSLR